MSTTLGVATSAVHLTIKNRGFLTPAVATTIASIIEIAKNLTFASIFSSSES